MYKSLDLEHVLVFGNMPSATFYKTPQWKKARYHALKIYGNRCQLCGSGPQNGKALHVDHIKPRFLHPERCLDFNNLQILCEDCHTAKGIEFEDDCRGKMTKINPFELKDLLRITTRHLVLEIRHPRSKAEKDYLGGDIRAPKKKHRQRWRALVTFCFKEKLSYPEAVSLKISELGQFKCIKGDQFQKFFMWGDERGFKKDSDPAFDIAGCSFPYHIIDLIADDLKDSSWRVA